MHLSKLLHNFIHACALFLLQPRLLVRREELLEELSHKAEARSLVEKIESFVIFVWLKVSLWILLLLYFSRLLFLFKIDFLDRRKQLIMFLTLRFGCTSRFVDSSYNSIIFNANFVVWRKNTRVKRILIFTILNEGPSWQHYFHFTILET